MSALLIAAGVLGVLMTMWVDRVAKRRPAVAEWYYGGWMVICVILSAVDFAQRSYTWGGWMAGCAVINGLNWWKHRKRRKRKRAAARLGEKSRALITKLVHRQREATQGAS